LDNLMNLKLDLQKRSCADVLFQKINVAPRLICSEPMLSLKLRTGTATLHAQIEAMFGMPDAIRNRNEYADWLGRFLGLYEPLERSLANFSDWDELNLAPLSYGHSSRLACDLATLGVDSDAAPRASIALLPDLPNFAHALGAYYVLEGAALGGRVILRDLEVRIGAPIAGATRFFSGRNELTGPTWQGFLATLDRFGCAHPLLCSDVVTGARRTFQAISAWFDPFCARNSGRQS
jgi:heme oxygenase (biliverdin-IX-beta and delta-forming)